MTGETAGAGAETTSGGCPNRWLGPMIRAYFENFAGEAVSVSRKSFDPFDPFSSQRFSQRRDLEGQIRVFHKRVRPKRGHELFLRKDPAAAFH